ncbi:MAG TPA: radical SAM protein, partial [Pyrinomonadaceae bacterium]|nr:radical SAM protein [Pyrinomonadaceae bacterium]
RVLRPLLKRVGPGWSTIRIVPIESGRGCPYGCEFCTVTGFFGDSIRFRTNQSIVDELLRLKARAKREGGRTSVFFVDDNFAINIKRTKSLLRDIIAADAQLPWTAQISANLLRDEELVDLIAAAGGMVIFIGMESIDPVNLADVNKGFNKPNEYAAVLNRLAERDIYAITSFIFGMDNDTPGVADRTLQQIRTWPPGLPVFGQLTPFPATPLYDRLQKAGRLTRPTHWLDFAPYKMAHTPLKMSIAEAQAELEHAWVSSYSPERIAEALDSISHKSVGWRIYHFILRLSFRGIYFPQMGWRSWVKVVAQNRRTIYRLTTEAVSTYRAARKRKAVSAVPARAKQSTNEATQDR